MTSANAAVIAAIIAAGATIFVAWYTRQSARRVAQRTEALEAEARRRTAELERTRLAIDSYRDLIAAHRSEIDRLQTELQAVRAEMRAVRRELEAEEAANRVARRIITRLGLQFPSTERGDTDG